MSQGVTAELRGGDGRFLQAGHRTRAERIRARARARWVGARTVLEQLSIADDRLSAAAQAALREGIEIGPDVARAVQVMWAAGDALLAALEERENSDG